MLMFKLDGVSNGATTSDLLGPGSQGRQASWVIDEKGNFFRLLRCVVFFAEPRF